MTDSAVILVEDNPDDEALTLMALQRSGLKNRILIARDGAEALETLFGTVDPATAKPLLAPALVLLDLKLPKIDGIEVLRRIRANEKTRFLPVVILTSSREERDVMRGYSSGANSYIVKPVDIRQFQEAIQSLGIYWMVLNETFPGIG